MAPEGKKGKKRSGRPAFEPTDEQRQQVTAWIVFGHTQKTVATFLGIDEKTMNKHFTEELRLAKGQFDAVAIAGLYKGLKAGEGWAVTYYLRTRGKALGWSERIMLVGEDNPFQGLDLTRLSAARFRLLLEILAQAGCDLTMAQQEDVILTNTGKPALPEKTTLN